MRNSVGRLLLVSALAGTSLIGCAGPSVSPPTQAAGARSAAEGSASSDYGSPVVAGYLETDDIEESSGLAASECQDVLWTHNDSGNDALLFGLDAKGRHLGTWRVKGAQNEDWESIAAYRDPGGRCFLVIGDIGDNDTERDEVQIHRIPEPAVSAATARSSSAKPLSTEPVQTLSLRYPDGSHNAETILVHPRTGDIHIVTKEEKGPAAVFRVEPTFGAAVTGERIAEVSVPSKPKGLITGGSYSPDGTRVMLCDEKGGYEFVQPDADADPAAIWRQRPREVDLGDRAQGEAVSYGRDGVTLFASSEQRNSPLYLIKLR